MSFPKDLEDYSDEELVQELNDRHNLRRQNKCGYCKQEVFLGVLHGCKHTDREIKAINELFIKNKPSKAKPKPEPFCDDCG